MRLRPLPMHTPKEWEQAAPNQPRGIAAAIAFDWAGLTFLVATLIVAVRQYGPASQQTTAAIFLLLLGLPLVTLGEMLRRGREGARIAQLVITALIGGGNLIGVIADLHLLLNGTIRWSISLPSLSFAAFVVWGLTRPQTQAWYAQATLVRARARYGGSWLLVICGVGIITGLLAAAVSLR